MSLQIKLTEVVKELRRLIWLLLEDNLEAHYSYIKQSWSAHWRNTVRFISEDRTHHKDYAYDTTECILLENGCVARVGWHLTAVVCSWYGLGCPAARLLSAVDVPTQPQRPVAAGASWNIHCRPPAPIKWVLSAMFGLPGRVGLNWSTQFG